MSPLLAAWAHCLFMTLTNMSQIILNYNKIYHHKKLSNDKISLLSTLLYL